MTDPDHGSPGSADDPAGGTGAPPTPGRGWLALRLHAPHRPLRVDRALRLPEPGPGQVRLTVASCGVCRTDLHLADGDLAHPGRPVVPGHEIVGRVTAVGPGVTTAAIGDRVGVPWLGWTCGTCAHCRAGRENLCPEARFTGWTIDGGYAEHAVADARYVFPLPDRYDDLHAAPLLCAGLIGWRSYARADTAPGDHLGLYGFGAAAHLVAQVAALEGRTVYAFTRPGDADAQALARDTGAAWVGGSDEPPPRPLDAALVFAPVGALVPAALAAVRPGGTVVCGGIHMSDIPSFPYRLLWGERRLLSVAHLTRADATAFLAVAARLPLQVQVQRYRLLDAQRALDDLRDGRVRGAAVLVPD